MLEKTFTYRCPAGDRSGEPLAHVAGLPDGVRLEVVYDRSELIEASIDTLTHTGFKFENPNAAGSCACGESFSV